MTIVVNNVTHAHTRSNRWQSAARTTTTTAAAATTTATTTATRNSNNRTPTLRHSKSRSSSTTTTTTLVVLLLPLLLLFLLPHGDHGPIAWPQIQAKFTSATVLPPKDWRDSTTVCLAIPLAWLAKARTSRFYRSTEYSAAVGHSMPVSCDSVLPPASTTC